MAVQVTTTRKVLDELNGVNKDTPWVMLPESYILSAVSVAALAQVNATGQGLILKAFINTSNGEIRLYLAKWLDTTENTLLP